MHNTIILSKEGVLECERHKLIRPYDALLSIIVVARFSPLRLECISCEVEAL